MSTVHVSPVADLVEHDTSSDDPTCVCGPNRAAVVDVGGRLLGFVLVHHSLDGRETG